MPLHKFAISTEESNIRSQLILPQGTTKAKVWAKHSIPDLLRKFDVTTSSVQLVPRCHSISEYAKAIPAFQHAIIGEGKGGCQASKEQRVNAINLDILWIADKPYVIYDLTGDWQTDFEGPNSLRPSSQQIPGCIIQDIEGSEFTLAPLLHSMWELLSFNSEMTFFLDGHSEDAAKLVALLSKCPPYRNNALVQMYPYGFQNGAEFVDMVDGLNPTNCWKRLVAIVPVLNPDTLPMLAGVGNNSLDYTALYTAGKAWISSMISTEMNIFGIGFPVSGIGHGVDTTTGMTQDLNGHIITDPAVKAIFVQDRVLIDLVAWAKLTYPRLAIIMHSITYSYSYGGACYTNSFHMGQPLTWPEGAESHGRELMAVPGNALNYGANIVICDRMNDNLNAVLGTRSYSWPADIDYPTNNVRMSPEGQGKEEQEQETKS